MSSAVVDSHVHFIDTSRMEYPWISGALAPLQGAHLPEQLAGVRSDQASGTSVAVQALSSTAETTWLLELAAEHDFIAGVVGWVDLTSANVGADLDRLLEGPTGRYLRGLRHGAADEVDPFWLGRDDVNRSLTEIGRRGLSFDLEVGSRELHSAVIAARRNPELSFVLDHLAKPAPGSVVDPVWRDQVLQLAALPNVSAKLSGLVTEARWDSWVEADFTAHVDVVLEAFGPSRLMFGSDWPVCELAATYGEVVDVATALVSALSTSEIEQVFSHTATTFYTLH